MESIAPFDESIVADVIEFHDFVAEGNVRWGVHDKRCARSSVTHSKPEMAETTSSLRRDATVVA
jgi:hypothetical protein